MNSEDNNPTIQNKISSLVEERGWNQEEFARITRLHRHTIRKILLGPAFKLRNATIESCARALGISVHDLHHRPLDLLLHQIRQSNVPELGKHFQRLQDQAYQPDLKSWIERNPERARTLSSKDADELVLFQKSGNFNTSSLEAFVIRLERKRRLLEKINHLKSSKNLEILEQMVDLMHQQSPSKSEQA